MIKNTILLLMAMIVVFMINDCNTNPKPATDASSFSADSLPVQHSETAINDPIDTAISPTAIFVLKAGTRDIMEIVLGQFAQQNAQSQRVKKFGNMMVTDHKKAQNRLLNLAESTHILVPASVPARVQSRIDEISKFKGAEFDRRYMILMADSHQKEIDLFEKTAKDIKDTLFKAYIKKALPILKMHLDSAKSIKNEL